MVYPLGGHGVLSLINPAAHGPHIWLDAADSSTITSSLSDSVSQWRDKSGNDRHANQTTNAYKPTTNVVAAQINSLNAIRWDGIENDMSVDPFAINTATMTIFIVRRWNNPANSERVFEMRRSPSSEGRHGEWASSTNDRFGFRNPDNDPVVGNAISGNPQLMSYSGDTATNYQVLYRDGLFENTDTSTIRSFTTETLGLGWSGASGESEVDIGEFIVYDFVMSEEERQKIEGYLANKWGFILPASHPYSSLWSPRQETQKLLWLDSLDISTITADSSNVSVWNDKSGLDNHARQSTGAKQPNLLQGDTINFGGTQNMQVDNQASFNIDVYSMFVVSSGDNFIGKSDASESPPSTNEARRKMQMKNGSLASGDDGDSVNFTDGTTSKAIRSFITRASNDHTYSVNGILKTDTTSIVTDTYNSVALNIGSSFIAAEYLTGNIYEIVIFSKAMTDSEEERMRGYLAWKWNLQGDLPIGHPYKTEAP